MKNWLKKIWEIIRVPVRWAVVVLITGLYLFSVIDAIVRCFHGEIFNGIVQFVICVAAGFIFFLLIRALVAFNNALE